MEALGETTELKTSASDPQAEWLARFHRGDGPILEGCYREHFASVVRAVGRYLPEADRETVVHEVFYRLISRPEVRQGTFASGTAPSAGQSIVVTYSAACNP